MKKVIISIVMLIVLWGCSEPSQEPIDTKFLCEQTIIPVPVVEPVDCEQTIFGNLTNEWMERIDTSNVTLNHYINDELFEDNLADIVVLDDNGTLGTSNPITIPEYVGQPMKHILIVEFWQTN